MAGLLERRVVSRPEDELGGRRPEQVHELYLGHRRIQRLGGFERFRYVNALYLEHNELVRLKHLEPLTRLTTLSVHSNHLTSITGVLRTMPCLDTLLLHSNALRGLDEVVAELSQLKYLATLTLFGNPVEEEYGYRRTVISACAALQIFDRSRVTVRERQRAELAARAHPRAAAASPPLTRMLAGLDGSAVYGAASRATLLSSRASNSLPRTPLYLQSRVKFKARPVSRAGRPVAFWTTAKPKAPPPPPHSRPELVIRDLFKRVERIHEREEKAELEELTSMFEAQAREEIQAHRRARTVPLPKSLDFLAQRRAMEAAAATSMPSAEMGEQGGDKEVEDKGDAGGAGTTGTETPPPTPFVYRHYEWVLDTQAGSARDSDDESDSDDDSSRSSSSSSRRRGSRRRLAGRRAGRRPRMASSTRRAGRRPRLGGHQSPLRRSISSSFANLTVMDVIQPDTKMYRRYQRAKRAREARPRLVQTDMFIQ